MRLKNLMALALVATTLPAFAEDKHDLRGPAPVKGQVVVSTNKMVIKEADATITVGGQKVPVKMSMTFESQNEREAVDVDGRQITKIKQKVLKEGAQIKVNALGQENDQDKPGELEGETLVAERSKDGKWKFKLVDAKPTDEQEKELKKKDGPESEDELYPEQKVGLGHAWDVDASKMKNLTGNTMTDVKGKMKQKFLKLETIDGDECAVIETEGKLTAKMVPDEEGDPAPEVEMEVKATGWKSLKTGLEVKARFEGKIKIAGKQKAQGMEVDIEMAGPISGESSVKFKAAK
jgi:RNase P/RNase MRP subunit p29